MQCSVIITTYNHPKWLEKVLWGYSAQTTRDFEIIVADDGSGPGTRTAIERIRTQTDTPIQHVWQQDNGFQKCRILNKAILESQAEYLIFTDGDCIPHRDFVRVHTSLAAPGVFLSGGYFKLPLELSRSITREDIIKGQVTDPIWLLDNGLKFTSKLIKLAVTPRFGSLLDKFTPTNATWNGHSASTWKTHIIKVNGFDERMQYGGLDRELGERLMNIGIKGKQIRHRAKCVHLDHPRSYANQDKIAVNHKIRAEVARLKKTRTEYGIKKSFKAFLKDNSLRER